ncbi:MAG: glycoside hydrolase family 9 protein [Bacteroidales bacterium]|nr:glycoside hydrolase family 9 protein [Bacteroidales bacterium]
MKTRAFIPTCLLALLCACSSPKDSIRINQVGFYPDESYMDIMPSYASNEIAINWNASLVAAINWLAYIQAH